jgi:hypothetical protein
MASPLDTLLEAVKRNVLERAGAPREGGRSGGLLDQLGDLLGRRKPAAPGRDNVRPASEDPYGDPADQQGSAYANAKPASEDPYGDPADAQKLGKNVRPASEDPYGDPADEGTRKA